MSINQTNLSKDETKFLLSTLENIKDFPKKGVVFSDITPLLANHKAFDMVITYLYERYKNANIDYIASIDARGFIFGSPLANRLGIGFVAIRKAGKLPKECFCEAYDLEYGHATLEIQKDAFCKKNVKNSSGSRIANVVLIDDILATGGSANAASNIIKKCNANLVEISFLMSLVFLGGVSKLQKKNKVYSILEIT